MPSPTLLLRLALAASLAAVAVAPHESRTGAARHPLAAPTASSHRAVVSPASATSRVTATTRVICRPNDPSCPPPNVTITPAGGTFSTASQSITIDWCGHAPLVSGTREISLNGVNVTSSFSYATSPRAGCSSHAASTGTVTLVAGANSVSAYIEDNIGQDGSDDASYTLATTPPPPPPSAVIPPPPGPPSSVPAPPVPGPVVSVTDANPGANWDRDRCFTVSGGPGVAFECGDLRLAHGLPGVQTYGAARGMSLLYNSRAAAAMPVIAAYVRTPSGIGVPAQVTAQLLVGPLGGSKTVRASGTWAGADFTPASMRRIALTYAGAAEPSGVYTYAVQVTFLNSSGGQLAAATSEEGELVHVNRSASPYGPGWSPSGVEQLVIHDATNIAWIGPDGSTRHYIKRAGENVWDAGAVDRPQYLSFDGTNYIRWAPHRTRILFNTAGQHVATINRYGRTTSFAYASGALSQVTVPGLAGPLYQFSAPGTSMTITAASVPGQLRVTTIQRDADGIRSICDPDGGCTSYAYTWVGGERHVQSVTDRRGTRTDVGLGAGHFLRSITRDATGTPASTTFPNVAESHGVNSAEGPTSGDLNYQSTTAWGARGVGDYIAAFVDRFGAPTMLINSGVLYTHLAHDDARFPGLVTRTIAPGGFQTQAGYDASGHLRTVQAFDPYGDGQNPITTYTWDTNSWDELTSEQPPLGEATTYDVDPATGNTNWVQVGTDPARRSTFQYTAGLLMQATTPGVSTPWSYTYDGAGNLSSSRSPLGRTTFRYGDAIGRDTLVVSPIMGTDVTRTTVIYDILSRVRNQITTAQGQTLAVSTEYEAGGAPSRVSRTMSPDPNALGAVVLAWEYDALGRQTREYEPATSMEKKSWTYDLAGNVKAESSGPGGFTVDYDALNRRTHVVLSRPVSNYTPGTDSDEQWFTYSPDGSLATANNKFAQIARTYYPNGALRTDTLRIANGDLSTFSQHVYGLRFRYDRNGRRTAMKLPSQLVFSGGDSTAYGYDPSTGALAWVEDGARRRFNYTYTSAGQVRQRTDPTGTVEINSYNDDGELVARSETSPTLGLLHLDTLRYDLRGKMVSGTVRIPGVSQRRPVSWTYDGMGAITNNSETNAVAVNDALGNPSGGASYFNGENRELTYAYAAGSTRMRTLRSAQGNYDIDVTTYFHDPSGNTTGMSRQIYVPPVCEIGCGQGTPLRLLAWDDLAQYYDGMGRLVIAIRTTSNDRSGLWYLQGGYRDPNDVDVYPAFERGVDEEYRYYGLGRRVWVRAKRDRHCPGPRDRDSTSFCESTVERTVYDGDQVLFEIRQEAGDGSYGAGQENDFGFESWSLFGTVGYTHGLGLDAPLAVNREGLVAMLHRNFHGQVDQATGLNGQSLEPIQWPAYQFAGVLVANPMRPGPVNWWGTLVQQKQNATGQLDMRNRNFDPRTGRFTQEDPIGLAGGMNLYGFAGGDPVNYSDPFGLCTPPAACPLIVNFILNHPKAASFINMFVDRELAGYNCAWSPSCAAVPAGGSAGFLLGKASMVAPTARWGGSASASAASLNSLDDALANPQLLKGMSPQDVANLAAGDSRWVQGTLGQGTHKGQGMVLREVNESGNLTGRMIQWHPGGGRHGPLQYWKVSTSEGGTTRVF